MNGEFHKTLKSAAIYCLVASGAVAASFISAQPAQAQSRVSTAVTNTQSNNATNSFAAEMVFSGGDISNGELDLSLTYSTVGDGSQLVITAANMSAGQLGTGAVTLEAATARAIDTAAGGGRFGDVIGIVQQWQSGGSAALD